MPEAIHVYPHTFHNICFMKTIDKHFKHCQQFYNFNFCRQNFKVSKNTVQKTIYLFYVETTYYNSKEGERHMIAHVSFKFVSRVLAFFESKPRLFLNYLKNDKILKNFLKRSLTNAYR